MAYTEKTIRGATNPWVEFTANSGGEVTAVLTFYRVKNNGEGEEVTVRFSEMSVGEVACIGSSARKAVYRAREKVVERMDKAYHRIITPGA
jgi:hypothetical protein